MRKPLQFNMDATKSYVNISLGQESVSFSMTYFRKGKDNLDVAAAASPFSEFNEWLKERDPEWQLTIFRIYQDIKQDIQDINNIAKLLDELNKRFILLYSHVNLDDIQRWISIPSTPVQVPVKQVGNYNRATTYDYPDYLGLVTYSFALRFIAPIWGDIHNRLSSEYGKDAKEIYSLELLHGTCMMTDHNLGIVCQAEVRLREFITSAKVKLDTNAVLVSGLSEDDFYNYLFAVIVLKKIAQGDISGKGDSYHLIVQTFFYLGNKIKQAAKSYGADSTQIQMKKNPVEDRRGNDSNSQSVLDVGFVRSRLLADEKVFLRRAINDHQRLIKTLCPDLPDHLYWESMRTIKEMDTTDSYLANDRQYMKPIQEVQLILTKWMVNEAVNVTIFDHLELTEMINLIGLIRAIYWHKGYPEFAAIISAVALSPTMDSCFIQPSHRKNIDSSVADILAKTYNLAGNTKSEKRNMSATGCIEIIEKGLSEFNWLLTLPEEWLNDSPLVHKDMRLIIPSNIRTRIGELMLMIEAQESHEVDGVF